MELDEELAEIENKLSEKCEDYLNIISGLYKIQKLFCFYHGNIYLYDAWFDNKRKLVQMKTLLL